MTPETHLAALAEQYTEVKVCYDHEDGFFLQWPRFAATGGWEVMDREDIKRLTIADAVRAAVEWHNADLRTNLEWRRPIPLS